MKILAFVLMVLGLLAGMIYCVEKGHNYTAFGLFLMLFGSLVYGAEELNES